LATIVNKHGNSDVRVYRTGTNDLKNAKAEKAAEAHGHLGECIKATIEAYGTLMANPNKMNGRLLATRARELAKAADAWGAAAMALGLR
jgi:hypothetical protein